MKLKEILILITFSMVFLAWCTHAFVKNAEIMEARSQQYACDWYAYDQTNAPTYCK